MKDGSCPYAKRAERPLRAKDRKVNACLKDLPPQRGETQKKQPHQENGSITWGYSASTAGREQAQALPGRK